jgi:MSHA pilin protein MshC
VIFLFAQWVFLGSLVQSFYSSFDAKSPYVAFSIQKLMNMRKDKLVRPQSGFTLLELVLVIVILGIISVFVAPTFTGTSGVDARGFHDETLAYLRYAQKTAIAQRHSVCVTFESSSVSLSISNVSDSYSCLANMIGPRGEARAVATARPGASYSTVPQNFVFDPQGQPVDGSGANQSRLTIQVAGHSKTIFVEPSTGYVHE